SAGSCSRSTNGCRITIIAPARGMGGPAGQHALSLLALHGRVEGTTPRTWEARPLVHLWGPRYSAFLVHEDDAAVFTLGRLPDTGPDSTWLLMAA
ncbi:MAG: hypothetical protein ACRD2X_20135, partial [Vicinamibacteraceae bacterium]